MASTLACSWQRSGEAEGVGGTALEKVSKVWGRIRSSRAKSVTKVGRPVDLPSDDSRDPLPEPPTKLRRWVDRVKALVTRDRKVWRWELVTWSDSDDEESGSCWSEDSLLTSCDSTLFAGVSERSRSPGSELREADYFEESWDNGSSSGRLLLPVQESSDCSGVNDVTGLRQKLRARWGGFKMPCRRKAIQECAVRSALKQEGNRGCDKRLTLRGAVDALLAGGRTSKRKTRSVVGGVEERGSSEHMLL
ncbi:hypothetical protein BSKO_07007 [Bryopsis sp. KO-2023]|nr:hypothetical protein BSKO_07007 [Bryopsis sp. KO-2023]